ncbi:Oidioi.mRNA.OKI2018_I69.PAR.g8880.t2.cds [Oikopleura dioica]|uniref:Oidioi.mRNA.OKI2018_I69.PAR.g8880.t2.cds n=1 Tax=Oikopleura dioica TaxID=34765 RepID=A0ABN7RMJ1_OIKDI|nr:Oidioi.mRNA.OKI2018_I69.PAR.g8880.t2.cds [Oikopleura dioica]
MSKDSDGVITNLSVISSLAENKNQSDTETKSEEMRKKRRDRFFIFLDLHVSHFALKFFKLKKPRSAVDEQLSGSALRHMDSVDFSAASSTNTQEELAQKKQRMSRVIDDSARHHYSISPELEAKTQEAIHNKYGGREKAENAAKVIQQFYRQYRLKQSFRKLRAAKTRRLTLDSLNTELEQARKENQKQLESTQISTSSSESSTTTSSQKSPKRSPSSPPPNESVRGSKSDLDQSLMPQDKSAESRLSSISLDHRSDVSLLKQRESYAESDDSDEEEPSTKSRHPSEAKSFDSDSLIRNQRLSWVSGSVGSNTDLLRKRMYRIGLNLLNKKPEKGLAFLIKQGFVEDSPNVISNFLITRKGISRQVIGEYLGNGSDRSKKILKALCNQMDLADLDVDEALRKFQSSVRIQGEAQRVERLVEAFSQRYVESNPEIVRKLNNPDSIFVLAFAIIMLNTDAHSPSMRKEKRMSEEDFVNNLRGIDGGQDLDQKMLQNVYRRVKNKEFKSVDDHINQVLVIEQRIIGKKPTLALPFRRLVCYCRMYQVTDVTRPQRPGLHTREVFLFNDLLLVTKAKRRSQYTYRLDAPLTSLEVEYFGNEHYPHAVRIIKTGKVLITFSLPNQDDCKNFIQDISESILEVRQMESLRIEESLESLEEQKEAQKSPLTASRKLSSSLHNISISRDIAGSSSSTVSTAISAAADNSQANSRAQKARSLQLTSPDKPNSLMIGDRSLAAQGDNPQSPMSIFSIFSKNGRKNSQTAIDKIKEVH